MGEIAIHTALLATRSEPLAMGLAALLSSIPPVQNVEHVTQVNQLLESVVDSEPKLIILDTTIAADAQSDLLQLLRDRSPHSLRILISEDMDEVRELAARYQDAVIIQGADPRRLARALEYLLNHRV
jgi:DNA-binding NarL/FixJ family response regulator